MLDIAAMDASKKKPVGPCGRHRLEGRIPKEEEEKSRESIIQEFNEAAILLSDGRH